MNPVYGEGTRVESQPSRENAVNAARRIISRAKAEALGGPPLAAICGALNGYDAEVLEDDSPGVAERDRALFLAWHERRGTDGPAALALLTERTRERVHVPYDEARLEGAARALGLGRNAF